ncbi:hypothetical protein [Streptomyces lasiicapitis]|uniref:hypothetical protein n=1 Tax=Streptomyces lasiicapitis TaxID=1923961 RepID=UPI0036B90E06
MLSGTDLADCEESKSANSRKTPMGGGTVSVGLRAPELLHFKWLSDKEAVTVEKSATYTLNSLYGRQDGVRALDIPIGEDRLVVEYRHASGTLDKRLQGVHTFRIPGNNYEGATMVDMSRRGRRRRLRPCRDRRRLQPHDSARARGRRPPRSRAPPACGTLGFDTSRGQARHVGLPSDLQEFEHPRIGREVRDG